MQHGFIGLGQMGRPMAINLARHFQVIAYDRNKDQYADLPEKVAIARTLEDLHTCDVVFLSLPNGEIIRSVLFETELSDHLPPDAIIVDTGTTEYETTLQIKSQLSQRNIKFIDTPVSGMQSRAEDGTLTMMCGGSEEVVQKLTPQLSTMATTILHMGPVGSGQLTKLINQLLFDINAAAIAEILPMAVKLGLDADKIGEIVNSGTGRSYASEFFIPNILKRDFSNGYPMSAAYKDLISAAQITAKQQIPTPVLAAATATYQKALMQGHGDKDKGGMICVFEELLKVRFKAENTE